MDPYVNTKHGCTEMRATIARYRTLWRRFIISLIAFIAVPAILIFLYLDDYARPAEAITLLFMFGFGAATVAWFKKYGTHALVCPHCRKARLSIGAAWVCGSCRRANRHALYPRRPTWLEECRFCGKKQSALHCTECSKPIPLDDGYSESRVAWIEGYPPGLSKRTVQRRPPTILKKHLR
jgi:hypothetical protein